MLPALALPLMAAAGCQEGAMDKWVHEKLNPPPTVSRVVEIESDKPDVQREALQAAAVIAGKIGIKCIFTHAGFIPFWPGDRQYKEIVAAL